MQEFVEYIYMAYLLRDKNDIYRIYTSIVESVEWLLSSSSVTAICVSEHLQQIIAIRQLFQN